MHHSTHKHDLVAGSVGQSSPMVEQRANAIQDRASLGQADDEAIAAASEVCQDNIPWIHE